ncbi:MAG: glycosyltransferase family 4 protein [Verrucomicrobiales bacterium]|nr:glycosyltransferase family 4 protein [Verrucomicrobiales bacterium]
MNARRRILFVDRNPGPPGGAEVNLLELLAHPGAQTHWDAQVACSPASPTAAALRGQRVVRHDIDPGSGGARLRNLFRIGSDRERAAASKRLRDILAGFKPDAVISCSPPDHLAAGMAAAAHGIPSLWWVNENLSPDFFGWPARRAFVSEAIAHATRLIPVSHFGKSALVRAGIPEGRISVIHNGIPLRDYRRSASTLLRDQLRIKPGEPLIGLLGKITPWKGAEFFIEIAARWASERRPGRFLIVGPIAEEDESFAATLRDLVRKRGLTDRISFPPPPAKDATTLSQLDVLLHCSVKPEPFGRIIIEGMAVGVPVIAARDGGVPEIITPGVDGGLARPGDLEDYVAQLTALLGNGPMRSAWVAAARSTVQQRFTLERVFSDFQRVLQEAADSMGRSPEAPGLAQALGASA